METILFHSNIHSKSDVPFINEVYKNLRLNNIQLLLTGWNTIPNQWDLKPHYLKLPFNIEFFYSIYTTEHIENEFKEHGLSIDFLLQRFHWWFQEIKNPTQKERRIAFLHFHLHHYLQLIKQYDPSLLLIWNGNDPRHYILKTLGYKFGIKMLFLERGPLPSVLFYDLLGVLSHSSVATLPINAFKNKSDIHLLYNKYIDWYFNSSETLWEQPKNTNESIRQKFQIENSQKITLFVGQVDNDIQTKLFSPYFSTNLDAFKWFIENARSKNHFVIGKHHPKSKLPSNAYESLIKDQDNIVWTNNVPLDECLKIADNVVAVNSSVIFDALLYKKPVLSLGKTMLDGKNVLYEYKSDSLEIVLDRFYNAEGIDLMNKNFVDLLEYMFNKNLLFTKDINYAKSFSAFLSTLGTKNNNTGIVIKHQQIILNYYNNIVFEKINKEPSQTVKEKMKNDFSWYIKKILNKLKKII